MSAPLVIAAGGTGGHTFPAMALASALIARGRRVVFVTDQRGGAFTEKVPGAEVAVVATANLSGGNPLTYVSGGVTIARGVLQARALFKRLKPSVVTGFGGFSTLPQMLAALALRVPTAIHEQNALLGRVNRLVASRVDLIATSFPEVGMIPARRRGQITLIGNPVRPAIRAALAPYAQAEVDGPFRLVIFGGSQGARIMSDVVPAAIARLSEAARRRLEVTQQARAEDRARTEAAYRDAGVRAEVTEFIRDMPQRLAAAHAVIARAGASTYAELTAMGRPSLLIPLPIATDDHQAANAQSLVASGGAVMCRQNVFKPDYAAGLIENWLANPQRLAEMAASALRLARPDAADRLADAVEGLIQRA